MALRHARYFRVRFARHWMFDDNRRMLRHAKNFRPDRCCGLECLSYDSDRRAPSFLKFYRIVETPRYAGSSIGDAMHDGIAGLCHSLYHVRWRRHRGAELPEVLESANVILRLEQDPGRIQKPVGHVLGIVDDSNSGPLQRIQAGGNRPVFGLDFGCGVNNCDHPRLSC